LDWSRYLNMKPTLRGITLLGRVTSRRITCWRVAGLRGIPMLRRVAHWRRIAGRCSVVPA
jgi:hypothetical protein